MGSERPRRKVTSFIFSVIVNGPQNLGWSFLLPEPSSSERFCVDSHTRSPTANLCGSLFLLAYLAAVSLLFRMFSWACLMDFLMFSKYWVTDGLLDDSV